MNLNSPRNHIDRVKDKIKDYGCTPHEIPGTMKLAIGITGATGKLAKEDFQTLDSVEDVVRVTKKYKLVSRMMKEEDTVINFGGSKIGGEELQIIAGPCSVESRDQIFEVAGQLHEMGIKFLRAGAFKPRSSPYSFQGLKEEGLKYLMEVKKEFGLNIVTELLDPHNLDSVGEVADVIQIGARNMQNFALLEEAGKTQKTILLKRGMSATIEDLLLSAEYIISQDNYNIILCERGIRTFETATRNTLDLNAVPVIRKESHLPIFVDPSHGIGIRDLVSPMALAGISAGADGLMIEVHSNPDKALSDGHQSLDPNKFKSLLNQLKELAPIVGRKLSI
jgi:3-deoxy-7-phosphoheptulonate synthase